MGDDKLRLIAHELLMSLRESVLVDLAHRDTARARIQVLVKRILCKYVYPPGLPGAAVQAVLQQADVLLSGSSASSGRGPTVTVRRVAAGDGVLVHHGASVLFSDPIGVCHGNS